MCLYYYIFPNSTDGGIVLISVNIVIKNIDIN